MSKRARLVSLTLATLVALTLAASPADAARRRRQPAITPAMRALSAQAHHRWDGLLESQIALDEYGQMYVISRREWNVKEAFAVMMCESRGDPNAKNRRSSATGLFQVLRGSRHPWTNVDQAYAMWQRRGWQPWKSCPWRVYLAVA